MEIFSSTPLSGAGRPILLENEVELKNETQVSVALQDNKKVTGELLGSGSLVLTNFRLILIVTTFDQMKKFTSIGWGIMLKAIATIEDCAGLFKFSTRLKISFNDQKQDIGLRFEKDGKDEFLLAVQKALERKSWERNMVLEKPPEPTEEVNVFSTTNAGVAGIIRRQERNLQSADNITKSALTDLDTLMLRAKEAISVVQRYASYTAGEDKDDAMSETTSQAMEKNEMETIMQNIGIVSPVTKFSAGRQYHEQLARQMADLLLQQGRLDRLGGMITLTDLYCLFNRARGTELVSPDDLLKAASLTQKLHLGLKLRIFDSGVKVIQADSHNEAAVGQRILALCTADTHFESTGIQASDLALQLNISLIVAKEQLLVAESHSFVCRDESTEGLYFFPNLFDSKFCAAAV
jgi:ESCRT-II complex subunit VPS36